MPVARLDYTQCENDRANIAYAKNKLHEILHAAEAQDILDDRPLRPPRRRLRHVRHTRDRRHRLATTAPGAYPTCSSATAASCPPKAQPTRR